ncbi:cyoA [Wigglesworthia glossinidia endosymbiont of Glossina brevipalpis]|uniref:Ubiquinol oxidase subunit 2 n=1 Tax=Wigglesworthia glossinidia brevipalpis TaxID=36870 RepID=Q8D354_WIGBR|nr:cyoA [Wigglesworthia glossinidia endosymbiont of Glossina brevipalpis]
MFNKNIKKFKKIIFICIIFFLSGCNNLVIMNPKGNIGIEEKKLILIAICIMLCIVIPVILMTLIFVIKYRKSNKNAIYKPNWSHSNKIEFAIWSIPIFAIIFLANITWNTTKILDPKNEIISTNKPVNIQVISLDWKWLFIYPEYNIATINEIAFPKDVPVKFNITSNSVMNSFFIPQLGSQIYAMAGMDSILHLISNHSGKYKGISSNFSGKGFSDMKFSAISLSNKNEFYDWIKKVKSSSKEIKNIKDYEKISKPSINNHVEYFSTVKSNLFYDVIKKFK